jgi:uncharacterized membrane protein YpjA
MAANAHPVSGSRIRLLSILRLLATVLVILLGLWPSPITIVALASLPSIPLNVWILIAPDFSRSHPKVYRYLTLCLWAAPASLAWFFLVPMLRALL